MGRHELIGLRVSVQASKNPANVGISGKIIDETQKSIVIRVEGAAKRIMKDGAAFEVELPNGEKVRLDGKAIAMRPWERING